MRQQDDSEKYSAAPEKITQFQCQQLNDSLRQDVVGWLCDSFKYFPRLLQSAYLELELLIAFAEYRLTIAIDNPQPGDYLQNISFRAPTHRQKVMWLVLGLLLPYLKQRILLFLGKWKTTWTEKLISIVTFVDKILTILELINYAVFIRRGEYRSLLQRVLGIRMQFINDRHKRILNFSLMNRQLLWRVYEQFLKTVLPHVFQTFGTALKNVFYLTSYLQIQQETAACMVCASVQKRMVMPMKAVPCGHSGCYYCIDKEQVNKCRICSKAVQSWTRLF